MCCLFSLKIISIQVRYGLTREAPNEKYTDLFGAIRVLAEGQKHSLGEMEHLKKAIDLLTLELFKVNSRHNSDKKTANQ